MDSFLDEPRKTPKPTPIIQEISSPIVPEVSLMFQNMSRHKAPLNMKIGKTMQSYNAWKLRSSASNNTQYDSFVVPNPNVANKENFNDVQQMEDNSLLSKKQVRFQSPGQKTSGVLQYPSSRQNITIAKMKKIPEVVSQEQFSNSVSRNDTILNNRPVVSNLTADYSKKSTQQGTMTGAFEKLYVSNIPNRELDLSFLEPAKRPCNFIRNEAEPRLRSPVTGLDHTNTYNRTTAMPMLDIPPARGINIPERAAGRPSYYIHPQIQHIPSVSPRECVASNPASVPVHNTHPDFTRSAFQPMHVVDSEAPVKELEEQTITEPTQAAPNEVNLNNADTSDTETAQSQTKENTTSTTNDTPSINDLLQIIKLQNDQLQMLQTQVDKLVKLNLKAPVPDQAVPAQPTETVRFKDQQVGTSFLESREKKVMIREESVEHKNNKISVGLMTSFEVSFKPPAPRRKPKVRSMRPVDDVSANDVSFYENIRHRGRSRPRRKPEAVARAKQDVQPPPQMFPESWKRTNETEYSMGLQESLEVQEPPESPDNSIHIDMHEYDTEDDDDTTMDPGWTFCRDIVGQVNNMCASDAIENYRTNGKFTEQNRATDTTMHCIKQATLQQLQQDGFMQSSVADAALQPNDISFAVKQLLMKYLPDDGLANVANRANPDHEQQPHRNPTDVSVATFKYMQQYNVVTKSPPYHGQKLRTNHAKRSSQRNPVDPKILDITTIKQQPKLL